MSVVHSLYLEDREEEKIMNSVKRMFSKFDVTLTL